MYWDFKQKTVLTQWVKQELKYKAVSLQTKQTIVETIIFSTQIVSMPI